MKNNTGTVHGKYLFIIIQTIAYVTFMSMDLTGSNIRFSNVIKFSMIVLCFCYTFFPGKGCNKSILLLLRAALCFTAISDYFILLKDDYLYGVISFILVQQFYGIKLTLDSVDRENKDKYIFFKKLVIRMAFQAFIALFICVLLKQFNITLEPLLVATAYYFICIVTNVILSIRKVFLCPTDRRYLLFAVGMVLFLLCDINVGLFNLSDYIVLNGEAHRIIYTLSSILMWAFYAPSQVIISITSD